MTWQQQALLVLTVIAALVAMLVWGIRAAAGRGRHSDKF